MPPKGQTEDKHDPETGEVLEEGSSGAVATQETGGAVVAAGEYDYGADAGAGFDNQTSEDVSVPFWSILQPGSPEVQDEAEGAPRPGQLINKTTGEVLKGADGFAFIPALTEHVFVEWVPRDKGGGFVAQYQLDDQLVKHVRDTQPFGKYQHPQTKNDIIETFYVYGVAIGPDGVASPAVLAFSSTMIKPYKDWMFRARSIIISLPDGRKLTKLPLFSHRYRMKTIKVTKKDQTWYNWVIDFDGAKAEDARLPANGEHYNLAKSVREGIMSGATRAATETLRQEAEPDATPGKGSTDATDAPY